jgi:hypothetical protein
MNERKVTLLGKLGRRLVTCALVGAAAETVLTVIFLGIHIEYLIVAPFLGALCGLAF